MTQRHPYAGDSTGSALDVSAAQPTVHSPVRATEVSDPKNLHLVKMTCRIKQDCPTLSVPALRTHGRGTVRTVYAALSPSHHSFSLLSVVTVMMWPLAVYHRLWDRVYVRLKPALQRLDFSVRGYMMSKQRERQCKCPGEPSVHLGSLGRRRSPEVWRHRSLNVEKWDVVGA